MCKNHIDEIIQMSITSILVSIKIMKPSFLFFSRITIFTVIIGHLFVCLFVYVEVLQPNQPNGVMSSTVIIAPACSRVRYRHPIFCPSVRPCVRPSVRPSVRLSTFMSTFDIYVKVSILINYKTKQPSNLA